MDSRGRQGFVTTHTSFVVESHKAAGSGLLAPFVVTPVDQPFMHLHSSQEVERKLVCLDLGLKQQG